MPISLKHDPEANALYITLDTKPYHHGRDLDAERRIDYAEDGSIIGIELLCVRGGVDLRELPRADEIADALRAYDIPTFA